jgi:hypothetical protein
MVRAFLKQPKAFAYAGFLAMIPKALISLSIGITLSVLTGKNVCLSLAIVIYPFIALMVDGLLYGLKDRLWQPLASNALIPSEWEINAQELEQYARNLPKVRLMRLASIVLLMLIFALPFAGEQNIFITLFTGSSNLFFLSVCFDPLWRRVLKIKAPNILQLNTSDRANGLSMDDFDDLDPTVPGSIAWNSRQMNADFPGTSAWIIQNELDSL